MSLELMSVAYRMLQDLFPLQCRGLSSVGVFLPDAVFGVQIYGWIRIQDIW